MEKKTSKYNKFQRIMALITVIALVLLAISSLVVSLLRFPGSARLSLGLLLTAIFLPIMLWIWIWLFGQMTHRRTIATITPEELDAEEVLRKEAAKSDSEEA